MREPVECVNPLLSEQDVRELDWWRTVFACRLSPGSRIKPGTPLYGYRFRIQVDTPDGWIDWKDVEGA